MHILLDHISAFLIAGILFIAVFTMMHRSRQSAVEMQVNQIIHEQAYEFLQMIERDLENIRSSTQVVAGVDPTCTMVNTTVDSLKRTQSITFPTLEVPIDQTLPAEYVSITYQMEHTAGDSAYVNGDFVPLFAINRYRQTDSTSTAIPTGTSGPIITHFAVTMYNKSGLEAVCPDDGDLGRTHIEFQAASAINVDYEHQKSSNNLNTTRFGATVYSPNR